MSKGLTIMWIVIIGGGIFITMHLFESSEEEPSQPIERAPPSEETAPPEEKKIIIEETPLEFDRQDRKEKDFSQLVKEGDLRMEQNNPEEAVEYYKEALESQPNSKETLVKLGGAYIKNNQPAQAKLTFEKALQIDPESIEVHLGIAQSNLSLRDIDSAKEIIWSLDQNIPRVKYYRGIIYILAKEFDRAQKAFRDVEDENSQQFLDAFTRFSHFTEADPLFLKLLLAQALTRTEQYEAAIPFIFDILNQKNNYRDAWILLGYAYLKAGKPLDSVDALMQAKVFAPKHPQILFYLGLANSAKGDVDNAINYLEAADLAGYSPKEHIRMSLGDLYLEKGRFSQAASNYRAILEVNQENINVFVRAIWLNIDELNNPQEALRLAHKAMENHPENPMSYNLLGWAYTANKDFEKAEEYLQTSLEMGGDMDAIYLNLGWLREKQERFDEAKEYYKKSYMLGQANSIGNRAAIRFNELEKQTATPEIP